MENPPNIKEVQICNKFFFQVGADGIGPSTSFLSGTRSTIEPSALTFKSKCILSQTKLMTKHTTIMLKFFYN